MWTFFAKKFFKFNLKMIKKGKKLDMLYNLFISENFSKIHP